MSDDKLQKQRLYFDQWVEAGEQSGRIYAPEEKIDHWRTFLSGWWARQQELEKDKA